MDKRLIILLAALAGGFLVGLVLSQMIGIISVLLFQQQIGIRYLPVYLALLFGLAVLIVDEMIRRKSG